MRHTQRRHANQHTHLVPAMPPIRHSEAEESNFLESLFAEFDSTPTVAASSASPSRSKRATGPQPRTPLRAARLDSSPRHTSKIGASNGTSARESHATHAVASDNVDYDALMEGVEDWDWDDMNSDCMSPRKSSPVKPKVENRLQHLCKHC